MTEHNASIYEVFEHQKTDLLVDLLQRSSISSPALVFVRSRDNVHALTSDLNKAGVTTDSIHGSKKPELRDRTLKEFLSRKFPVLVATESVLRERDLSPVNAIVYYEPHERDDDYREHLGGGHQLISLISQSEHNQAAKLDDLAGSPLPRKKLEGFPYASQPKNKKGQGGGNKTQSKPLQHKKPKLKNKGPRRKTGRTRKR